MILVVSSSLREGSTSRRLAHELRDFVVSMGESSTLVDLSLVSLPFCDGDACYEAPELDHVNQLVSSARAVIFTGPIYNYDVSSTLKNFIELVGHALDGKVVGFAASAGGERSYMAPLSFLNSLMIDFRTIVIPRYVYASPAGFTADGELTPETRTRLRDLAQEAVRLSSLLTSAVDSQEVAA